MPRGERAPSREPGSRKPWIPGLLDALGRGQSDRLRARRGEPAGEPPPSLGDAPERTPLDQKGPGPDESDERDQAAPAHRTAMSPKAMNGGLMRPRLAQGARVIGYVTVAEDDGETEHAVGAIDVACRGAKWELIEIVRDRDDGTRTLQRPGLNYALRQIAMGYALALVVGNAKHLSRSIVDLGALMDVFSDAQAALIALDLGVDTSTPEGRRIAAAVSTLGAWERERIVRRTQAGLDAARSRGSRVGRPGIKDYPALGGRIREMRDGGMTLQEIADELNAEGVPTVRGGQLWRPSSVQTALGYRRPGGSRPTPRLPQEPHTPEIR